VVERSPDFAFNTWAYTGYTALLFYAGMLQIPQHLTRARPSTAPGNCAFQRITLRCCARFLALVLVVSLIGSFQIFDTVAVVYQGSRIPETRVIYFNILPAAFTYSAWIRPAVADGCWYSSWACSPFVQLRLLAASRSDLA